MILGKYVVKKRVLSDEVTLINMYQRRQIIEVDIRW
jgi:hypothetical protein